jgi:hypothetical protein
VEVLAGHAGQVRRHELRQVERLGDVVVGAPGESVDEVLGRRRRRQHEHSAPKASRDELRADMVAVNPWQVPVEDDHVVVVLERALQPRGAVERNVDRHLLPPQRRADDLGQLLVVFDHKHAHRLPHLRLTGPSRP